MRVAVTGATGFIGRAVAASLAAEGHDLVVVSRSASAAQRVRPGAAVRRVVVWDPGRGEIDAAGLEGSDVVIHLAGESIGGVWTAGKKRRIRESRVRGTELIAATIARLDPPPAVFLAASGTNYYGSRPPDTPLDEDAEPGSGFIADTVVAWESGTRRAEAAGIRTARLRMGAVLDAGGGALGFAIPFFRLGLGARLGSGDQMMSWIALPDVVAAVRHIIAEPSLAGPVNLVSPEPVTNAEFTRTLARTLGRPAFLTAPVFALRLLPGGIADELLLGGARVVPRKLEESGFRFRFPRLEDALRHTLRAG